MPISTAGHFPSLAPGQSADLGGLSVIRTIPLSARGLTPSVFPLTRAPSASTTVTSFPGVLPMTWAAVRTSPSSLTMTPLPAPMPTKRPTVLGVTFWTTCLTRSWRAFNSSTVSGEVVRAGSQVTLVGSARRGGARPARRKSATAAGRSVRAAIIGIRLPGGVQSAATSMVRQELGRLTPVAPEIVLTF